MCFCLFLSLLLFRWYVIPCQQCYKFRFLREKQTTFRPLTDRLSYLYCVLLIKVSVIHRKNLMAILALIKITTHNQTLLKYKVRWGQRDSNPDLLQQWDDPNRPTIHLLTFLFLYTKKLTSTTRNNARRAPMTSHVKLKGWPTNLAVGVQVWCQETQLKSLDLNLTEMNCLSWTQWFFYVFL